MTLVLQAYTPKELERLELLTKQNVFYSIGYVRVSSKEQGKTRSVANQVDILTEYGCEIIFVDVESAFKRDRVRQGYDRMMETIKSATVKEIMVVNLNRLTRDEVEGFSAYELITGKAFS